ncbi:MAG TPA: dihydroorotate dehydrogenase [Acidimicrobiia bacterium]|nr:dihydroorotate dehydrogenase [Acidimicrobiia bacterium]
MGRPLRSRRDRVLALARRRETRRRPSGRPPLRAPVDLRVRLGPLELPNPVIAASGTFGHADEVGRLCPPDRLGAVTAKSQAPFPWPGNPAPRLHMTTGGMINAVGLQGRGIEHWIDADLPALRALGARVIASVWGHDVDDFAVAAKALRRASAELVAVEVNVSCPNLHADGARGSHATIFAHDPGMTEAAVRAVVDAELGLPVFAKLSPNVTDLAEIASAAVRGGATGLTLINTLRALAVDAETRLPTLGAGAGGGGLSGAAVKPVALRAVHDVARAHPSVPIIGTGGVFSGVDAVEMLLAGASAVGVGTATFLEPRASLRILAELVDWCVAHDVARVADLTGALPDRDEPDRREEAR